MEYNFRYVVVEPMILIPTSLRDYKDEDNLINWYLFGTLDKVDFLKQESDMIYVEVVKSTKTKKILRESLRKVEDILKEYKWTTRSKKVTFKEMEKKIVALSSKPDDGSQFKSIIDKNDNEI